MATITFKNVNKLYDNKFHAVHDFNLEVKNKEFIVFVGPSGCGKSTTLRMVAGFEDISSGEIWIDDTCVNTLAPKDRNIAMVFQNYALYPHMTVFDNMAFALKLRKVFLPITEIDENNPEYIKECDDLVKKYEEETNQIVAQMKSEKKSKDEIKDYKFRQKTALIEKLEAVDAKYETQVMTFDSVKTTAIEKEIAEAKKEQPINQSKIDELKKKLDKEYDTLETPAYAYRHYNSREIAAKVNETAQILGLIPYLKRKPAALSGGQRQRVALGRAIVRNPKVFLMDEPLSNLDAKLRVQTRSEIIKIHEKVGATTIYVTHDQTEAMTMASRIVIMSMGYVQQVGTPKEVYEKPKNIFVAGFIGSPSMNFINGKFDGENFVFEDGEKLKLASKDIKVLKNYKDKEIIMGIRPEHIFVSSDKTIENKSVSFPMKIDMTELLGSEVIAYSDFHGTKIVSKLSAKVDPKPNEVLDCVFDEDCVHFFDPESTEAIR